MRYSILITVGLFAALLLLGCEPLDGNIGGEAARFIHDSDPQANTFYVTLDTGDLNADVGDTVQLHLNFQ